MVVFVFPGQGSQKVGMGKTLSDTFSAARETFDEIDDALSDNLSKICFDGSPEDLQATSNTQPALFAASMAILAVLEKHYGFCLHTHVHALAGHSLGEYTALAAAGCFSVRDGAKLLRTRGKAMEKAVPGGKGTMAAILGLDYKAITEICDQGQSEGTCVLANDNCVGQVVISGETAAIAYATTIALERGAKRVIPLNVSGPFHSPLMQPAAETMARALEGVTLSTPRIPVIANVSAKPIEKPDDIRINLVKQLTGTVRWRESMEYICTNYKHTDCTSMVVELGAGRVLTGLMGRINKEIMACSLETPSDLDTFMKNIT
ncbi:MAG: ACP S-malonyltransferase [Alphaproteobacteria bacterium]|nr:MAG: ACP S-malonyltransferase [Alphaproteobacteria bacterium]